MEVPMMLTVPLPSGKVGNNYGVKSVRHSTAERIVIRIRKVDRETIQQAARLLNMSEAQFVRETAVNMAKVVLKYKETHNENASHGSG